MKTTSYQILKKFLESKKINLKLEKYLEGVLVTAAGNLNSLPEDIVIKIIADAHESSAEIIKKISMKIENNYKIFLGRVQKNQLKLYIDYGYESDFNKFLKLLRLEDESKDIKKICNEFGIENKKNADASLDQFISNLNESIKSQDTLRIQDYLVFLYSRLIGMNERKKLSLKEIFEENSEIMKKELTDSEYNKLYNICNVTTKENHFDSINKFNFEYIKILEQNGNKKEKNAVIYLNISQSLFDKYNNTNKFYSSLFTFIKKAYDNIQNHKSLIIKIENIISDNINIKWEIYSYLTIFTEKFNKVYEERQYYVPEIICADFIEHKNGAKTSEKETSLLKQYYDKKISFEDLQKVKNFQFENAKEVIDDFHYIYTGFTFIDCIILQHKEYFPNSKEIEFIKNNNELLLVFVKHKIDDRKIPCPICGSLKISGNSFPEIGIRSWECKNILCPERSKTNRGKRYSERTILMQKSNIDTDPENAIPKEIISKWRKDIVENWNLDSLYTMITKYYSYVEDPITIVNAEDYNKFKKITDSENRSVHHFEYEEFVNEIDDTLFDTFFTRPSGFSFIDHFIYENNTEYKQNKKFEELYKNHNNSKIIVGDCAQVLRQLKANAVHNMVTSPPYYNAREYSQWENLYQYLNEMYKIIQGSYHALQKGGVFFFNIGDIFDNEKIIVKSKMGEKRVPLGAYIIFLFKKSGFEVLDNIVWNKGEPQSNRHKNDGNYTPYYQRPANCYEHMFIFKKPGAKLQLNKERNENPLTENIQRFIPVYKIGRGGINLYGHSAPFPQDIPLMSALCFTNPSEIVLDPFSGSGTSVIVASKNNRTGMGIEQNKEFVELSVKKAQNAGVEITVIDFEVDTMKVLCK